MPLPLNNYHTAPFDAIAAEYDVDFSNSLIGKEQRRQSRYWLQQLIRNKNNLQVLEVNCGTGDDAFWLAGKGHTVIATDGSPAMIAQARQKLATYGNNTVQFAVCDFQQLEHAFSHKQFDLLFSNFAGLNCLSQQQLQQVSKTFDGLLKPGGHLAMVVFGKHTLWETGYYLYKRKFSQAFRRWHNREVTVPLNDDVHQPVYYHSVHRLVRLFLPLRLVEKKPVGLLVPPSYLESVMQKRPRLFRSLLKLEEKAMAYGHFSSLADHTYLLFKKDIL